MQPVSKKAEKPNHWDELKKKADAEADIDGRFQSEKQYAELMLLKNPYSKKLVKKLKRLQAGEKPVVDTRPGKRQRAVPLSAQGYGSYGSYGYDYYHQQGHAYAPATAANAQQYGGEYGSGENVCTCHNLPGYDPATQTRVMWCYACYEHQKQWEAANAAHNALSLAGSVASAAHTARSLTGSGPVAAGGGTDASGAESCVAGKAEEDDDPDVVAGMAAAQSFMQAISNEPGGGGGETYVSTLGTNTFSASSYEQDSHFHGSDGSYVCNAPTTEEDSQSVAKRMEHRILQNRCEGMNALLDRIDQAK